MLISSLCVNIFGLNNLSILGPQVAYVDVVFNHFWCKPFLHFPHPNLTSYLQPFNTQPFRYGKGVGFFVRVGLVLV